MRFLLIFTLLLIAVPIAAQTTVSAEGHLNHQRHHFRHGEPLATDPIIPERFTTDRKSEVVFSLPKEDNSFTFVVFGDRTAGRDDHVSVLADAVHDVNLLEPDFVINIGDMVQGYNTTELWLRQCREYKEIMDQLKCPWFPTAGNHDVYWGGPNRPKRQHEENFETHFGPLWYAVEHKNCWFIVLFTDEGNPETGEKNFWSPECQKMSEEQFQWLKETLQKTKNADHVFVFQHQPRWQNPKNYGDDWDRVHKLFVDAGNVSAVFAGHTHTMRYEKKDGIEHFTLSTTGGNYALSGVPKIGFQDNFLLLNVRKDRFGVAAIPVSDMFDPRVPTPETTNEIRTLQNALRYAATKPMLRIDSDEAVDASTALELANTTSVPIEVKAALDSRDSRWIRSHYPQTFRLEPGEKRDVTFQLRRPAASIDTAFREPFVRVDVTVLTSGMAMEIPTSEVKIPVDIKAFMAKNRIAEQAVLKLSTPGDKLSLPSVHSLKGCNGLTLETWFRADAEGLDRQMFLFNKGRNSELGLVLNQGRPRFRFPLTERTNIVLDAEENVKVEPNRWYHLAGVYDGREIRLYLDGRLIGKRDHAQKLPNNTYPIYLGVGVAPGGDVHSEFVGRLDSVRLSKTARYEGEEFEPKRDFANNTADDETLLQLDMQETIGRWIPLPNQPWSYGTLEGDAEIVVGE